MDWQAVIAIGSFCAAYGLSLLLARHNLKKMAETRPERIAQRRAEKRIKNRKLAAFYGIKYDPKDD